MKRFLLTFCFASLAWGAVSQGALAHFPWLVTDSKGNASLFFGEGLDDRTYKMPDSIKAAKILTGDSSSPTTLDATAVESDDFVGLISNKPVSGNGRIWSDVTYGVYHGNRLNYCAASIHGGLPSIDQLSKKKHASELNAPKGLHAELFQDGQDVCVMVTWNGKPLADVEVKLFCDEGHEEANETTDKNGRVEFNSSEVEDGVNGIMFGHTVEGDSGEIAGQGYASTMYYYTLTFRRDSESKQVQREFAELPFEITSFGAACVDDTAYIYGGHTGNAHSYSTEEQSNKLLSLDLNDPSADWKVESTGTRLQGLAMVPHGTNVIIIGGFSAKNAPGEEHDLHSVSDVRQYNTKTKEWSSLPSLPKGRSSHDAAIVRDTIYVVGGWTMSGDEPTVWHDTALSLDLSAKKPQWKELPAPPFTTRALATVAHDGKLFVIGGMDQKGGPTRRVHIFDPAYQQWTQGPELLGEGNMAGFGAAGWSIDGALVVSTYEGDVLRLASDYESWINLGKSETSRFFHRLLPFTNKLLSVGGANMEEGKYLNLEVLATTK